MQTKIQYLESSEDTDTVENYGKSTSLQFQSKDGIVWSEVISTQV